MKLIRFLYSFKSYWNVQRDIRNHISGKVGMIRDEIINMKDQSSKSENDVVIKQKRVAYSLKHYEAMTAYLDSKECRMGVKSKIPSHFMFRKIKSPNSLHLIDSDVASHVFQSIEPYLHQSKGHILEINAGVGMLTELLLKAGLPRLRIYESDTTLNKLLHVMILKERSDAKLFRANLLQMWNMMKLDREDNQNRFGSLFEGIPNFAWEDEPVMKIIVTIPLENFITFLIYSTIFQSGICTYGRPELYVTIHPSLFHKLTVGPEDGNAVYRQRPVMFQLLFDYTILTEVPEKAYVPWMIRKKRKLFRKNELNYLENDLMYLVKITGRQDLLQKVPAHRIKALWFFVRQLLQKRKASLIASMEQWAPGCGPRLIAQGYTIFTKNGTISPEEFLNLFQTFASWPEFQTSSFLPSMESVVVKMGDPGMFEQIMAEGVRRRAKIVNTKEEDDCLEEDDEHVTDDEESDSDEKEVDVDR